MKTALLSLLLIVGSSQAAAPNLSSPERWIGASPSIVVSVTPGSKAGLLKATAYIIDSRAGQLIDSPSQEGPAGDHLYLEGKAEGMGHTTKAGTTIKIAADGKSASYSTSVERDGTVLRTESGTLQVQAPGA